MDECPHASRECISPRANDGCILSDTIQYVRSTLLRIALQNSEYVQWLTIAIVFELI